MFHESGVGCSKPHFAISLPGSHLAVVDRQASAAPAGTSGTEATPPLLPLVRHAGGGHVPGHVPYPVPPLWGSLPSNLSLREGFGQSSEHKPPTGAKLAEGKPHEMARSGPHLWRALLLRLGFHLAALSLARRRSNARPGALSHPQLLYLDGSLVLRRASRRSHRRRAVSYLGLAGLV